MLTFEENGVKFAHLGLDEYEAFEASVRSATIAYLKAKTEKLSPADAFVAWRDARADIVITGQVHTYVRETKEGAAKALDRAMELAGVAAEKRVEVINSYDMLNAGNLAAMLIGFEKRQLTGRFAPNPPPATSEK